MKTTLALMSLLAVSLVAAPQQTPPTGSQSSPTGTSQQKKGKHRHKKTGQVKTKAENTNPAKS